MVQCSDDSYYTGTTVDISQRIQKHNSGKGAKYTRNHLPVTLVYSEVFENRSTACQREFEIKKLNRKQKEELIIKKQSTD